MRTIIVSGALANKSGNGGGTWERLSWVTGFRRLGFDVYFVEQIADQACIGMNGKPAPFADSVNLAWFRLVTKWFGLGDRAALIRTESEECVGLPWTRLMEIADSAELLVNLSGHLTFEPLLCRFRRKAYVDVDPGFTQFWHADAQTPFQVGGHDFYFTIGENIGRPDCTIPTDDIPWRPIRQPVVLADWPVVAAPEPGRFTTVASWRGAFGPVSDGKRTYGLKVHEFRKVFPLPRQAERFTARHPCFEIALDIHPSDARDLASMHEHGWHITDPKVVAGDPAAFRRYIQESGAEFSVAQGIYVETNSGWFSDRTVRYLASAKPALVQETGFSRNYSAGVGLVPFRTLEEAVAGAKRIVTDYDKHCRAARTIAEEYFDSDKVLGRLLEEVGIAP